MITHRRGPFSIFVVSPCAMTLTHPPSQARGGTLAGTAEAGCPPDGVGYVHHQWHVGGRDTRGGWSPTRPVENCYI